LVQEAESSGFFEEELRESGALRCVGEDDSDVGTEQEQCIIVESATEELPAFFGEDRFLFQTSSELSAESSD